MLGMERPAFSIFPRDGKPVYLVPFAEEGLAKEESWIEDIRIYEFHGPAIQRLVEILSERQLLSSKIAIELEVLPASFYRELVSLAPNATFVDSTEMLSRLRMIKEDWEIDILAEGSRIQTKAIEAAYALARPGDTRKHVADMIISNMFALGMQDVSFFSVGGSGEFKGHAYPSEEKLKIGDIATSDCGGLFKGYCTDMARTYVIGEATPDQRKIWRALALTQKEGAANMKAGTRMSDIYNICKKTFEDNYPAAYSGPFIAHGLGLNVHEDPFITADNEELLEENMVLNLELVYFPKETVYHVEDTVLVTTEGAKVLTGATFDEEIPVIS